jgi:hypothetical protein
VVELFTSEGCSSCPPADRHLANLESDARASGRNVIVLSFHVDYWNRLGWRDPFSDARHSERQATYAHALGAGQLYTPQMVVNGREEFTGTARAKVHAAIERGLSQPPPLALSLAPKRVQEQVEVVYRIEGDTRDTVLNVAVTAPVAGVAVLEGENAGRTLAHSAVVRAFGTRDLRGERAGALSLELPSELPESASVVAYVTDRRTLAVLGAASASTGALR